VIESPQRFIARANLSSTGSVTSVWSSDEMITNWIARASTKPFGWKVPEKGSNAGEKERAHSA